MLIMQTGMYQYSACMYMYNMLIAFMNNVHTLHFYFIANFSAGADFTSDIENGTLQKNDINISECVNFTAKPDDVIEGNEMFTISLSVDNKKVNVSTDEVTITVEDLLGNVCIGGNVRILYVCNKYYIGF